MKAFVLSVGFGVEGVLLEWSDAVHSPDIDGLKGMILNIAQGAGGGPPNLTQTPTVGGP